MTKLFKQIIPSLTTTNNYCYSEDYNPFVVNRAMSQHIDTIFYAEEMNCRFNVSQQMQYDFYFYSIKKYKRQFVKWTKKSNINNLAYIKEYYNCSDSIAKQYLEILTDDQINVIISRLDTGGV